MWEFCVQADNKNADYLDYIKTMVAHAVVKLGGVITSVERGDITELVLAVPKVERPKIKGMLDVVLANVFCEKFKYKFLKEKTTLIGKDTEYFEAFVRVLTYFDAELDRKIIARHLVYGDKINLESFFEFRLRMLKQKWEELTSLTNENAFLFLSSETFIELLKFLISNIEPKYDALNLSFGDKAYITTISEKSGVVAEFELSDEAGLLAGLIDLSPNKLRVEVGSSEECGKMVGLLCELFGERVSLVS